MDEDFGFGIAIVFGILAYVFLLIFLLVGYNHDNDKFENYCSAKGGVVVDSYCIKRDVVIGVQK